MQTIRLDVSNIGNVRPVYVKQKDVRAYFAIELYENWKPYTVDDSNTFSVWYSGPSGEGNYTTIEDEVACVAEGNRIKVQMIAQMLLKSGDHKMCVIMFGQDNEQKGFWNIPYVVQEIPGADSEVAEQYFSELSGAAEVAQNSAQNAKFSATRAEAAALAIVDLEKSAQNAAKEAKEAAKFSKQQYYTTNRDEFVVPSNGLTSEYIWGLYDTLMEEYPGMIQKKEVYDDDGSVVNYEYVISTGEYPHGMFTENGKLWSADTHIKKQKYLILNAIHGTERKTTILTYRFICDLLSEHNVSPFFKEGVILHVIPVANPDGFDNFTPENGDGVNINRDFAFIAMDRREDAAKETRAISNWLANNKDANLFIDCHNSNFTNEVVAIIGSADNDVIDEAKKVSLQAIDRVIPFWKTVIPYTQTKIPIGNDEEGNPILAEKDLVFAYSASVSDDYKQLAISFATNEVGIPSIAIETLVYAGDYFVDLDYAPNYQPEAIALGAEALGNILLEFHRQALSVPFNTLVKKNVTPTYSGEVVATNNTSTQSQFYNKEVQYRE